MRRVRRAVWIAVGFAVVAAAVVWRAGIALVVDVPADPPDVIVSLASHEWERLPEAARLARAYPQSVVILTQPPHPTIHNCAACSERVGWLGQLGVPASRVRVVDIDGDGTFAEAWSCRRFLDGDRPRRLTVVTSPYHTRRALAAFRNAFAGTRTDVGVQPATRESPANPPRWWMAPYDRWYVAYEWLATVYYVGWHRINPALFLVSGADVDANVSAPRVFGRSDG